MLELQLRREEKHPKHFLRFKMAKKQLKITKSKILEKSKERSLKDLTSSLQPNINKKSKIKYLD